MRSARPRGGRTYFASQVRRARHEGTFRPPCFPLSPANASPTQCLWKVSKTVKESLESSLLVPSRLLYDINSFLNTTPPAEWRRRASDGIPLADMPLRTLKTILQQVVAVYGAGVFDALDEISQPQESFVFQYLTRLANTGGEGTTRGSTAISRQTSVSSFGSGAGGGARREIGGTTRMAELGLNANGVVAGLSSPTSYGNGNGTSAGAGTGSGGEIELNNQLKVIFDLIGDPVNSRTVSSFLFCVAEARKLIRWCCFRRNRESQNCTSSANSTPKPNPASRPGTTPPCSILPLDTDPALSPLTGRMSKTGSYFQTYLKRALDNLSTADSERSHSTTPLVSPLPPLTPTCTSSFLFLSPPRADVRPPN